MRFCLLFLTGQGYLLQSYNRRIFFMHFIQHCFTCRPSAEIPRCRDTQDIYFYSFCPSYHFLCFPLPFFLSFFTVPFIHPDWCILFCCRYLLFFIHYATPHSLFRRLYLSIFLQNNSSSHFFQFSNPHFNPIFKNLFVFPYLFIV